MWLQYSLDSLTVGLRFPILTQCQTRDDSWGLTTSDRPTANILQSYWYFFIEAQRRNLRLLYEV